LFYVECKKRVFHNDRDVEFITFKKDVIDYLKFNYYDDEDRIHNFEERSCEMIATELLEYFDLEYCSVFEDNENGAEVYV
tara:strand:- start:84 stop:323 length:240 start_codon:yes stop_codon:yes gene_type:complete